MTDGDAYGSSTAAYLLCLTLIYVNAIAFILLPIYSRLHAHRACHNYFHR